MTDHCNRTGKPVIKGPKVVLYFCRRDACYKTRPAPEEKETAEKGYSAGPGWEDFKERILATLG